MTVKALARIAEPRGQTVAQLAISWVLRPRRNGVCATAAIGVSNETQLKEDIGALRNLAFTNDELVEIDGILASGVR